MNARGVRGLGRLARLVIGFRSKTGLGTLAVSVMSLVAFAIILAPGMARACAVCGQNNQTAFLVPTIFLSLLPLGLIGGGVYWWRRSSGTRRGGEFDEREDPTADPDESDV